MKTHVAVLKTSPKKVIPDYGKLMQYARFQEFLPKDRPICLKINISWHKYYPACSTTPWQLEGVIRTLLEHGYSEKPQAEICCGYEVLESGLKITIQDWGKPFTPEAVPEPKFDVDLCDLKPRGAGLYFMKKLMDKVEFDFDSGDGNLLVMIKQKNEGG